MKLRLLLLNFLFFAFINAVLAAPPSYIQTKDGVIIFTDPIFTGSSRAVKLEVISDNIIRVTADNSDKKILIEKQWADGVSSPPFLMEGTRQLSEDCCL